MFDFGEHIIQQCNFTLNIQSWMLVRQWHCNTNANLFFDMIKWSVNPIHLFKHQDPSTQSHDWTQSIFQRQLTNKIVATHQHTASIHTHNNQQDVKTDQSLKKKASHREERKSFTGAFDFIALMFQPQQIAINRGDKSPWNYCSCVSDFGHRYYSNFG